VGYYKERSRAKWHDKGPNRTKSILRIKGSNLAPPTFVSKGDGLGPTVQSTLRLRFGGITGLNLAPILPFLMRLLTMGLGQGGDSSCLYHKPQSFAVK